ncbi:MAG: GNAT family N-acetyltransferase [Pseudomonadales bacterium]|nr:GNAT family N-acetyltransferase [Pseudomonadales bacterium]
MGTSEEPHFRGEPTGTPVVEPPALDLRVRDGDAEDAWAVASRIGEFGGDADRYGRDVYLRRLAEPGSRVLIASVGDEPVGFKAGYDRYRDGSWYSWMGGVVAPWRGRGIAQALLDAQERWVRDQGYRVIYVKTRNRHKRMISFLAANDYDVLRVDEKAALAESRVLFCKRLIPFSDAEFRR